MFGKLDRPPDIAAVTARSEAAYSVIMLMAIAVLVELFTSEGCSSCPPADALLKELQDKPVVAGAQLVVLSEHVDYWNSLGWRDPFSSEQFTERQSQYGSRSYTPEAVIDGGAGVVGSDRGEITAAVSRAMSAPHGIVTLRRSASAVKPAGKPAVQPAAQPAVQIVVAKLPPHEPADVLLALVEDGIVSEVARGENAGRTLPHTAVVRTLRVIGEAGAAGWSGEVPLDATAAAPGAKNLRPVVFVQERKSRKVIASGL
jgi:hypothetical protein